MSGHHRFPFEKHAKLDNEQRQELQPPSPLVSLVAQWSPAAVLDIGAGTGYFALPLAQRLPDARIVALDVEPRMLSLVAERATAAGLQETVEILEAPEDRIPLDSGTVDVALMVNLYHELSDRPSYLAEVSRVLAPGGRVLVNDFDPEAPADFGPPTDHRIAPDLVLAELAAAGFTETASHDGYQHLYLLSATRP